MSAKHLIRLNARHIKTDVERLPVLLSKNLICLSSCAVMVTGSVG